MCAFARVWIVLGLACVRGDVRQCHSHSGAVFTSRRLLCLVNKSVTLALFALCECESSLEAAAAELGCVLYPQDTSLVIAACNDVLCLLSTAPLILPRCVPHKSSLCFEGARVCLLHSIVQELCLMRGMYAFCRCAFI